MGTLILMSCICSSGVRQLWERIYGRLADVVLE